MSAACNVALATTSMDVSVAASVGTAAVAPEAGSSSVTTAGDGAVAGAPVAASSSQTLSGDATNSIAVVANPKKAKKAGRPKQRRFAPASGPTSTWSKRTRTGQGR